MGHAAATVCRRRRRLIPVSRPPTPSTGGRAPARDALLEVRAATAADLAALLGIEDACFPTDRMSQRSLRRMLASGNATLVAHRGGEAIGYCCVLFRRGGTAARLYSIAVHPDHAGRGAGTLLLATAEDAARAAGCRALRLEVRARDAFAVGWYTRAGYRPVADLPRYYADGAPARRLAKPLPAAPSTARGPEAKDA